MPKSALQKNKVFLIIKYLSENSDETHPVSTKRLIEYLASNGISAERRTIYSDIQLLRDLGYDILQNSNRLGGGYYLGSREFEIAELKLLVDAVQSSRFITAKKSRELIKKLEQKASRFDAGKLQRQVYVAGRIKTENESVYYTIDCIHNAIQENLQIQFQYMEWNLAKKLVPRENRLRTVSPWALIWKDENYYLAAYDEEAGLMKHFRVDKMGKTMLSSQKRVGTEAFEKMDPAAYTNQIFGMFQGKTSSVSIDFPNRLIGVVLDRFGRDIFLQPISKDTFRLHTKVNVSPQFFGWLAGLGPEVKIHSPGEVREDYRKWIASLLEGMNQE